MLWKKMLRTTLKYKTQFISMILMLSIGIGIFMGFHIEWYSLEKDTQVFLENTNYADYRIYSESGFSEDDINAIQSIEGVESATRFFSLNVSMKDKEQSIALTALEQYCVSTMIIMDGKEYDLSSNGIWLSDKFATQNNILIGDTVIFTYQGIDIEVEVVGVVKSGEYMICVSDATQLMPDYRAFGFGYVSPELISKKFGGISYNQIHILSDLPKEKMETDISAALEKTIRVVEKSEHPSYAAALSEIEEGKTMGAILPVLFLAIAILTMITTIHRITLNEKLQIGILKALGFKNYQIIIHYTLYGIVVGIIGSVLGTGIGFGIASFIINPNIMQGTYFDMIDWSLHIPWFCYIALFSTIMCLMIICFLSVKKMINGKTAETLRPFVPKKVRPLLLEKTRIWKKISFGGKWNLRDIMRHKSRTIMTLIGIVGCMVLLVGSLGMRDTMVSFLNLIDNEIYNYETKINIANCSSQEKIKELKGKLTADTLSTISVQYEDKAVTLEIYDLDINNPKIHFVDKKNKRLDLSNDGVYLCQRLSSNISVGDMITFMPYGSTKAYHVKVAGFIRSVFQESIIMTEQYAQALQMEHYPDTLFVNISSQQVTALTQGEAIIDSIQSKQTIMDSYDSFLEIMNTMIVILVLAAVILGVVVLYNLGVMSYIERYRELATLKVLGFNHKHISQLLIGQNLWLTFIGIIIGFPLGIVVLKVLLIHLASEYELKMTLGLVTCFISVVLTLSVSLIVSFLIICKNKRINMVESLKMVE